MNPIIGVPLRSEKNKEGKCIEYIFDMVRRGITKAGGEVLAITPPQDINYYEVKGNLHPPLTEKEKIRIDFWLDLIQGLFIPGGTKFSEYDRYLLERAIEKNIPILGVCLGMQMMSCYGMEVKLEDNDEESDINHNVDLEEKYAHKVTIKKDSKLYEILGKEEIMVNSFHKHHGTENNIYESVAYSEDGVLEAIEYPGSTFNIGVQWHPEKMIDYDENAKKLMEYFIKEASKRTTKIQDNKIEV